MLWRRTCPTNLNLSLSFLLHGYVERRSTYNSDESAQDLHSMALMGNAEIVVAGQQDRILSINMIRGIVTKKVYFCSLSHTQDSRQT